MHKASAQNRYNTKMLRTQQLNQFSPTTSVIQQKRQAMFSKGNLAPGVRDTTTSLISTRPPTEASQLEAARSLQSLSESPYYTSTIDVPMRPDNHVSDITELKVNSFTTIMILPSKNHLAGHCEESGNPHKSAPTRSWDSKTAHHWNLCHYGADLDDHHCCFFHFT